jgi:hypothetical protein
MQEIKPVAGMILYSSWGYEQTNIDYYKVVRVSEKGTVWIQELAKDKIEMTGWASFNVVPVDSPMQFPDDWDEIGNRTYKDAPVSRHKWQSYGVRLNSFASAWVWDGKPKNQTEYA